MSSTREYLCFWILTFHSNILNYIIYHKHPYNQNQFRKKNLLEYYPKVLSLLIDKQNLRTKNLNLDLNPNKFMTGIIKISISLLSEWFGQAKLRGYWHPADRDCTPVWPKLYTQLTETVHKSWKSIGANNY